MLTKIHTAPLPLILLSKGVEFNKHKEPAFANWPSALIKFEEAEEWVKKGGGIGLNVASSRLSVIDIDTPGAKINEIAEHYGRAGFLVTLTPGGGLHIIGPRGQNSPPDGMYTLEPWHVRVEWYAGSSARNIVLPVEGTPRALLGGMILWESGKKINEPAPLATMLEILEELANQNSPLAPIFSPLNGNAKFKATKWQQLLKGKNWRSVTPEEVCDIMRNCQKGQRHNTLLSLSALWLIRGFGDVERLKAAAEEAWKNEETALKEINSILSSLDKLEEKIKNNTKEGPKTPNSRKWRKADTPESILTEIFPEGGKYLIYNGNNYIIANGWAFDGNGLRAYAASHGISISEERANILLLYAAAKYQQANVTIAKAYPRVHRGRIIMAARCGGIVGYLETTPEGLDFIPIPASDVVVIYGDRVREISPEWLNNQKQIAEEYLEVISTMLRAGEYAWGCLIAPLITGAARGGLVITGPPGSGKSSISLLLQHCNSGTSGFVRAEDVRSFIAAANNSGVVGIDESDTLDNAFQDLLKTVISFGRINVRRLYTTAEIEQVEASISIILSSVEVRHLAPDLMRRMAVIEIPNVDANVRISEDELISAIQDSAARLIVGALWLISTAVSNAQDKCTLLYALRGGNADNSLPAWLSGDSKRDWARGYFAACQRAGVKEYEARSIWEKARGRARILGLGVWADVLHEVTTNPGAAAALADGMKAVDICKIILGINDEQEIKIKSKSLGKTALRCQTAMSELGYNLERKWIKNKFIYTLTKINNGNQ